MIPIYLLESTDIIEPTDWCRPLQLISMSGGMSDGYSFKSCYSGKPENNVEWVKVSNILGQRWFGETVENYNNGVGVSYEFVRGSIPLSHQLDMSDYK